MRLIPRASRAQGESTARTGVFVGFRLARPFFVGRFRVPPVPALREGEVFVAMVRQA